MNWKDHPIESNKKKRRSDWKFLATRKELLLDKILNQKFLIESLLQENEFEKSSLFKEWVEVDLEEVDGIDK